MLSTMLEAKLKEEGLSIRQAAKITGVAHSTILRTLRGESIDLETVLSFAKWLEVKPATLLNAMSENDTLAEKLTIVLKQSPKLADTFEEAIGKFVEGKIPLAIVNDIAAYASYRIRLT